MTTNNHPASGTPPREGNKKETLSASRMATMLACPRKHFLRYELGLSAIQKAHALRFGTMWHTVMEMRWKGHSIDDSLSFTAEGNHDASELDLATLRGLATGYFALRDFASEPVASIEPEVEFRLPLMGSRTFEVVGFIDGIGTMKDGRKAMVEHKTTGEDISPSSDYWLRLRHNSQVFQYVLAARALGHDVTTILYDVTRKPSIRQRQGETVEQFGNRLADDTRMRPEFYFARREVPILQNDLDAFESHRIQISRMILSTRQSEKRLARREDAWIRNCGAMSCQGCEFAPFCLVNAEIDQSNPPIGFYIENRHQTTPQETA